MGRWNWGWGRYSGGDLFFCYFGEDIPALRHSGEGLLTPSFRRRPESILILPFRFRLPRFRDNRAFVPVGFRPPSWRASHFLCLPKESNQRKGTLEDAVTRASMPA
jgi:hypothetical protein